MKGKKANNYDTTGGDRVKRRRTRIKDAGLAERQVICHPDDTEKVRVYAEKMYKKRGITLNP